MPCRQAKVRCGLETVPCSRCVKFQIPCTVNPDFKRTNKRDKVNELEDNIQTLRSIIEGQSTETRSLPSDEPVAINRVNGAVSDSGLARGNEPSTPRHYSGMEGASITPQRTLPIAHVAERRSLGSISISVNEIEKLFTIFFEKYHPLLPILDPTKTFTEYYEASTPLFWAIISVALRSYKQDSDLLTKLTPVLCTHLWTEVGAANKNQVGQSASDMTEIQSMLLLSAWPLSNARLWSDRSLVMSNMALTSAMFIGLHRPGFDFEYARHPANPNEKAVHERSAVWVACYCISVNLSLEYGHPPLVPARDWLISNVCARTSDISVPLELRHFAIIQRQANSAFQSLSEMNESPAAIVQEASFFPHMALFEKELFDLDAMLQNEMSLLNKTRSQGALLLLQNMYFLADPLLDETKEGILRAYDTATGLLAMLISDDSTYDLLSTGPHTVLRTIIRAAFTILRVLFSSCGTGRDHGNGKMLYNTSTLFLRQMSLQSKEKDQPIRVAEALKMTWKHMEQDPSLKTRPPDIKIRSRLGASMQYDCLVYFRDAVKTAAGRTKQFQDPQVSSSALTPASMTSTVEPLSSDRLALPATDWSTPSFEDFMESDLSWMDSLVYPGLFS